VTTGSGARGEELVCPGAVLQVTPLHGVRAIQSGVQEQGVPRVAYHHVIFHTVGPHGRSTASGTTGPARRDLPSRAVRTVQTRAPPVFNAIRPVPTFGYSSAGPRTRGHVGCGEPVGVATVTLDTALHRYTNLSQGRNK
jgi:hypothetical protein